MRLDKDLCTGCKLCVPYCPVAAISVQDEVATIDRDACVECGVCFRANVCPVKAFEQEELSEPRAIRQTMSDPTVLSKTTSIGGRGTMEMKSNDVSGRFKRGYAGVAVELGRPGVGAFVKHLEAIAIELCRHGVVWEKENPITSLMSDLSKGTFKKEYLEERVLSGILEFLVPTGKLDVILELLEKIAKSIDTVFVVSVISKLGPNGEDANLDELKKLGYTPRVNTKVNVGLGKPQYKFD